MLRRNTNITGLVALLAVVLMLASAAMCAAVSVGSKAPDFTLTSFDGKTIKLNDYKSKPTVLVFWASWCPHCVRELPVLDRLHKDLRPKGVSFIGINLDSTPGKGREFVTSRRISFPMAQAKSGVAEAYNVTGIPSIFVLGKGGVVKAKYAGEVGESRIRADLAKLGVK